jgi:hypothetical protein
MIRMRRGNPEIIAPAAHSQMPRGEKQAGIAGAFPEHPMSGEGITVNDDWITAVEQ